MTTVAQVEAAIVGAQKQRFEGLALLRVDEAKATPADLEQLEKLRACVNGADLDEVLEKPAVNAAFCKGALCFGMKR